MDKYADMNLELAGYLRLASEGDKRAFEKLYGLTAPKLNAIVLGMVRDPHLTHDILQRAYISIWKNAGSFDPAKGKAFTWMLVVTRNRAIDALRQKKRQMPTEMLPETLEDEDMHSDVGAKSWMLRRMLAPHLETLNPDVRKAIILYTVQGMNSREIGEHMNVSTNTVKSWLRRGLAKLQNDIDIDTLDEIL